MSRKVLEKQKEISEFHNVTEYRLLKKPDFFDLPEGYDNYILELACGYGEYTLALANKHPQNYYIGVDIKGKRIWKGAKQAQEDNIYNAHFIRTYIDQLDKIIPEHSIDEIWITFPDPQPSKKRKRLTHPKFLDIYKNILKSSGVVRLKTDDALLYNFTLENLDDMQAQILEKTEDLYNSKYYSGDTKIQTRYEQKFSHRGIKYIAWQFK